MSATDEGGQAQPRTRWGCGSIYRAERGWGVCLTGFNDEHEHRWRPTMGSASRCMEREMRRQRPRNVLARNWPRATLDITVGNPWRLAVRHRRWRFLISEPKPMQRTIEVHVGPLAITSWIKSEADAVAAKEGLR